MLSVARQGPLSGRQLEFTTLRCADERALAQEYNQDMDREIAPLDKTICGMPEELRFEDGTPVYDEEGYDRTSSFKYMTPEQRRECEEDLARFVEEFDRLHPDIAAIRAAVRKQLQLGSAGNVTP